MKTTSPHIEEIHAMLNFLSEERLCEIHDFIAFIVEKERKHKAFIEETLKAMKEPTIVYESIDDAVKAVFDEMED